MQSKPNFFVYGVYKIVSKFVSKFKFNLKVLRNETKKVKGPYVIIANHESIIDFICLTASQKRRMSFVISNSFFQSLKVNPILKKCGVIPKQQFQTSVSDMKKMKKSIINDIPLVLYPAGMMTENGISNYIPESTGKFIKWLDVDVYIARIKGSYFTKPKWSKIYRKGRIDLDVYKLYSKDDLGSISSSEILNRIEQEIGYNCYYEQEQRKVPYKNGNILEGLENVIYKCPVCNKEFSITAHHDTLTCTNCGLIVKGDNYGFLHSEVEDFKYKYVSDWSQNIEDDLLAEIENNPNYQLTDECSISMIDYKEHKFVDVGKAQVTLNQKEIIFDGILRDEKFNESFSIKEFQILPFTPGKYFEFQNGQDIYRVYLKNGNHVMKWISSIKCFFKLNK